jgi:hypothetical protein
MIFNILCVIRQSVEIYRETGEKSRWNVKLGFQMDASGLPLSASVEWSNIRAAVKLRPKRFGNWEPWNHYQRMSIKVQFLN